MMDGTFTTASTIDPGSLTMEKLEEAKRAIQRATEDPLRAFMVEKGFDPARGGVLFLPEKWRSRFMLPFGPPDYIRFSRMISEPILGDLSTLVLDGRLPDL
jgi:hypothetical protein